MKVGDLVKYKDVVSSRLPFGGSYLGIITEVNLADTKARVVLVSFENQTAWLNVSRLELISESR